MSRPVRTPHRQIRYSVVIVGLGLRDGVGIGIGLGSEIYSRVYSGYFATVRSLISRNLLSAPSRKQGSRCIPLHESYLVYSLSPIPTPEACTRRRTTNGVGADPSRIPSVTEGHMRNPFLFVTTLLHQPSWTFVTLFLPFKRDKIDFYGNW
jgi:hypothetical protein